jgi:hypothetical protein
MGAWEPSLPPIRPSDLESPSESDRVVCRSSSPHACYYSLIESSSPGQSLPCHKEYGQFTSPFETVNPRLRDFSDFELPSYETMLEAMTIVSMSWEDLHCGLCFLPPWETFQVSYRGDSWSKTRSGLCLNQFHK